LEVAFWEIYRRGFQAVGVREIAATAEMTIGAFFHHFPTKSEVGYAIVDEYLRAGIMERWISPLAAYKNPIHGILKTYKKTFDTWPDEYVKLGCPLNNLTQEMSAVDPKFHEKSRSVLLQWIAETEKYLQKGAREGYLKANADTKEMAELIVTLQEGTFAMGKALGDRRVFDSMYGSLKTYLEAKAAKK
jgi:AcrR family transcriptional regulator